MNWTETIIISAHNDTYKNALCIVYLYNMQINKLFVFNKATSEQADIVWDIV